MDVRREEEIDGPQIVGFIGHGFRVRVNGQDHVSPGGIRISPLAVEEWNLSDPLSLTPDHAAALVPPDARAPEFLLLGTGPGLVQPPRAFARALEARDIGVEVMDSRAAARVWNVLRSEERWIIGALLAV